MARAATDDASTDAERLGDNSNQRYEHIQGKLDRLEEIKEAKKELSDEANEIIGSLEKDSGVHRGALAEVRRTLGLGSVAAMNAKIKSRNELEAWFVQPKIDEAAAGEADE